MCGYHELKTPCCREKTGFAPSPAHRCTHYFTNNRYCRTGSIHSWILPIEPLTSKKKCENCKTASERRLAAVNAEIEKDKLLIKKERAEEEERRKKERAEEEQRRKDEEARQVRLWEKETKRAKVERKEGKKSAREALRSQLAGMRLDNGEGPSSGRKN
jgi:hypothetical protein